jgi:hypothetical protein
MRYGQSDPDEAFLAQPASAHEPDDARHIPALRPSAGTSSSTGTPIALVCRARPVTPGHPRRQDPVVPFAHAEEVVRGVPGAQPQWLDRCGHFPQFEHAESVNARLRDFLYAEAASR